MLCLSQSLVNLPKAEEVIPVFLNQTYANKKSAIIASKFLYDSFRWLIPVNQSKAVYFYHILGSLRKLLASEEIPHCQRS